MIAEQILSGEVQPEIGALLVRMAAQSSLDQSSRSTIAIVLLGIVWIAGILDAWRVEKVNPTEQ